MILIQIQQALWFSGKSEKCNKCSDFDSNTASVEIFKAKCRKRCDFQSTSLIRTKNSWHISVDSVLYKDMKTSIVYPFSYQVKIIGYVQHYHQWFHHSRSSRSNLSLLFKVFFQGAVRLRVFTMSTSIGGNPPHLSSYFSVKGLTFVHFLYLWFLWLWFTLILIQPNHVCT